MAEAADAKGGVQAPDKGGTGMMKIIIIVVGAIVLVAASVGASLFMMSSMLEKQTAEQPADGEDPETPPPAPIYFKLDPAFVVNFMDGDNLRFLQLNIELMTHDPEVPKQIEAYMPVIRNNIVLMLSSQEAATFATMAGKQKLRAEVLANIQKILEEQTGAPGVEEVYFTGFVMQ
ncbi:MAG TPA: flagellar basal body-associated FliL family protein [Gammaproteobacteria bacterium]|nr:flagellar basal body-associated FliL family protein [Gammaproteobacteria bacterium]